MKNLIKRVRKKCGIGDNINRSAPSSAIIGVQRSACVVVKMGKYAQTERLKSNRRLTKIS